MLYKRIFLLLFIAITAVNIYVYRNRDSYTFKKQSTYNEIYPSYSGFTAAKFSVLNDSTFEIAANDIGNKNSQWVINKDGQPYTVFKGLYPQVIVPNGKHNFTVFNKNKDSFCVQAEYMSAEDYNQFKLTRSSTLLIFNSTLLQPPGINNLDKWKDDEVISSPDEAAAVAAVLKDSMKVTDNETTVEKIKKIGCYLGFKLFPSRGTPSDSLGNLSVYKKFTAALTGSPIWCGNYTMIFNLFALKAGIKTRHVEISKTWGTVPGNLHVFNEYYIPEQKKWAAIDLTFNNIFYTDTKGNLLNAVQVKNAGKQDSTIKVLRPHSATELVAERFDLQEPLFFETYSADNDLKFYLSLNYNESNVLYKKLLRYFQIKYYYESYSDNSQVENRKFWQKQLFLLLQLIMTVLLVLALLLNRLLKHD